MTLATVQKNGRPSARIVLYKDVGIPERIHFFTNYKSHKSRELQELPHAALIFFWPRLGKQIRIEGRVTKAHAKISDAYWATRPRESQIGGWASLQSQKLNHRRDLEKRVKFFTHKFKDQPVPRPKNWGGFVLKPTRFEFWQAEIGRLHQRESYQAKGHRWIKTLLYP